MKKCEVSQRQPAISGLVILGTSRLSTFSEAVSLPFALTTVHLRAQAVLRRTSLLHIDRRYHPLLACSSASVFLLYYSSPYTRPSALESILLTPSLCMRRTATGHSTSAVCVYTEAFADPGT